MLTRTALALAVVLSSAPAFAAADLVTTLTASQSPALVYSSVRYSVNVSNTGNKNAAGVSLAVTLPATATSPQVFVFGNLGAMSTACTRTGTTLNCALGNVDRNRAKGIFFDLAVPVSTRVLQVRATASMAASENTLANNTAIRNITQAYHLTPVNTSIDENVTMQNSHCTGQNLSGYFECTKFPSSISAFETSFAHDGTLSVVDGPDYFGTWEVTTTAAGNALTFEIEDSSGVVATFNGFGADANCFEGITTFPGSTYVAPYRVCPTP